MNPYERLPDAPPTYGSRAGTLASRGQRFGGAMIDAIIGIAVTVPILWVTGGFERMTTGEQDLGGTVMSSVLGLVAFFLLHGYLLATEGQTLGKKLIGTRIVDAETGEVPPFGRIVLRYLSVQIPAFVPCVGGLWNLADSLAVFRDDHRCFHDLIAGTRVVVVE